MDSNNKVLFVVVTGVFIILLFACCAGLAIVLFTADSSSSNDINGLSTYETSEYTFYYPSYYMEGTKVELANEPPEAIYSNPDTASFINLSIRIQNSMPSEVNVLVCEDLINDSSNTLKIEYSSKDENFECFYIDSALSDLGIELVSKKTWKKNGIKEYSVTSAIGEKSTSEVEKADLIRSIKSFELK